MPLPCCPLSLGSRGMPMMHFMGYTPSIPPCLHNVQSGSDHDGLACAPVGQMRTGSHHGIVAVELLVSTSGSCTMLSAFPNECATVKLQEQSFGASSQLAKRE